ncbi:MAG: BrnA antitoxin family protein [Gallionellaceae bacterium]
MTNKLTDTQMAELKKLAKMPEERIDYSDIPPLGDQFWVSAVKNPFYRPTKQVTTVRIDADVLAWLRSKGKGYQTKINGILRDAMIHEVTDQHEKI